MTDISSHANQITIPDDVEVNLRRELIDELGYFAAYNRAILSDVHATFEHMEEGVGLTYGLDFEVIYAYANPWSRDADHAEMVRYIIEEDKTPLTLLPGTVEELFDYIRHVEEQRLTVEKLRERLEAGDTSDSTIQCALSLCKSHSLGKYGSSRKVSLPRLSLALLEISESYSNALRRTEELVGSDRIVDLASLQPFPDEPIYNEALARHFVVRLATVRKGSRYRRKNEADAKNIATIVQHAQLESKALEKEPEKYKGCILRLLTNTHCILDMQIEPYNDKVIRSLAKPLKGTIDGIPHSLGVRSFFEACYAAAMINCYGSDKTQCRQKSSHQLQRARLLEIAAESFDENERNRRKIYRGDTARLRRAVDVILPDFAKEFLTDKWYQTVKSLLVVDAREQESKKWLKEKEMTWWVPLTAEISDLARQRLLDIQRSTATKVEFNFKKSAPKGVLAKVGVTENEPQLVGEGAPKRWIVENIFVSGGEEIFTFDRLDGVLCGSWPCGLVEAAVVRLVNRLFLVEEGLLAKNAYHGEVLVVYGDEEYICRLCKLPLKSRLTLERYRDLLSNLKDLEAGVPGETEVPSEIRCDTTVCSVKLDLLVQREDEGIMFAFKDSALVDVLLVIFQETSSWAEGWQYAAELNKFIEKEVRRRIKKWK